MPKRKLKRQLNLPQVIMLGSAGAIGAEIFVLTGHAAELAGPAVVLALLIGGFLSYSLAINYSELATSFPETGGALTYVREAWGRNLLTFLVESLDCLSSTFYAALSAVGFAYSLQIFLPFLPVVPVALAIIAVFIVLNILGVNNLGNLQVVLGGLLLIFLLLYVILGLVLPGGFQWQTFLPEGRFFIHEDWWGNFSALLSTVALAYVAFIGFEVIADDAEEVTNPDRNLPWGIFISLTILIILYPLIALVTLGTVPWSDLAGSETALTDAANRFLPSVGPLGLGITGLIATLTTLNTAMLSATREAFTMSRDGMWPRFLSRLGQRRTPYAAILVIGGIVGLVAAIGVVDFLSYISSSGYLFVLFWSNLSLIRLRQRYPNLRRPFRVPFFPLTAYLAMATCFFIIAFTERRALLFGVALLAVLSLVYYAAPFLRSMYVMRVRTAEKTKDRILVPVANPRTGANLVHLAAILAQASEDTSICVLHITPSAETRFQFSAKAILPRSRKISHLLPDVILREALSKNVPLHRKIREASSISTGILAEIESSTNIKLILAGWPGPLNGNNLAENPVKILLEKADTNVGVFLDHNLSRVRNILVPIGGGVHSRLALRLAYEIAEQENAHITALHTYSNQLTAEEIGDKMLFLTEIVESELGFIPLRLKMRVAQAESVIQAVLSETQNQAYDLLVMGASEEYGSKTRLFGSVDDWIIEHLENCSVLLVRHHEPAVIHWLRQRMKVVEKNIGGL
jgi:amino acid transporter/nucleotide-binding universal stress UspA family protein